MINWLAVVIVVILIIIVLIIPISWTYKIVGILLVIILGVIAWILLRNLFNRPATPTVVVGTKRQ